MYVGEKLMFLNFQYFLKVVDQKKALTRIKAAICG